MGLKTPIEWAETTWNPSQVHEDQPRLQEMLRGTTRETPEGDGPEELSKRLRIDITRSHAWGSAKMEKAQVIFVNSMSDLFQDEVPLDFIQRVFETMRTRTGTNFRF